jgi:hypothetical protein
MATTSSTVFKSLRRFVEQQEQQRNGTSGQLNRLVSLRGLPFYRFDLSSEEHRQLAIMTNNNCCFNHKISLPVKQGKEHELYDYEEEVFNLIFKDDGSIKDRHTLILKASGIGISELLLRIVAWVCTKDDALQGSQVALITGPRLDLSVALMERLKKLFYARNLITLFESKETIAIINGVRVECFPSHHLSALRGLDRVHMIIGDEAAFFTMNEQTELRDTCERYIGKNSAYIVLCSTPNKPSDLMDQTT